MAGDSAVNVAETVGTCSLFHAFAAVLFGSSYCGCCWWLGDSVAEQNGAKETGTVDGAGKEAGDLNEDTGGGVILLSVISIIIELGLCMLFSPFDCARTDSPRTVFVADVLEDSFEPIGKTCGVSSDTCWRLAGASRLGLLRLSQWLPCSEWWAVQPGCAHTCQPFLQRLPGASSAQPLAML